MSKKNTRTEYFHFAALLTPLENKRYKSFEFKDKLNLASRKAKQVNFKQSDFVRKVMEKLDKDPDGTLEFVYAD